MGLMKFFYLWNDHHKELAGRFFLPTFLEHNAEKFALEGVKLSEPDESVSFGTRQFQKMTAEKAKAIADIAKKEKSPFVVSDCDIQFFGPISGDINEADKLEVDVVFQKESDIHGVNTGFMLIRPSEKVSSFWDSVVSELCDANEEKINDQHVVNRKLGRSGLSHGLFGPSIWAYSQGNLGRHVLLHHANCTMGLEAKIRQFNRVRRSIGLRRI